MMSDERSKKSVDEPVILECALEAPPEKVWRALTEPALLDRWLPPEGPGERTERRLLAAEPNRLVRYGWRGAESGDSVVTFELSPAADGGTWLRLVHDGLAPAAANSNAPILRCAA
jgi:uncharacterized protein YndB with AHSA1/START domain